MLHTKLLKSVAAVLLVAISFTACKKDPFSEKDAIAAQGSLLQQMYSYQAQIASTNASASRSHDSALIAIQILVNSGATSLAILQAQQNLAYLMQQYANQVAIYKLQDSLSHVDSKFNDSLTAARNNSNILNNLKHSYTVRVKDYNSSAAAITGATVSAFSYITNSIVTATTDANGVATFSQVIIDPSAYFYISNTGYASSSVNVGSGTYAFTISLWNNSNAQNTVQGQIVADLDLTNGDAVEGVSGQLITFSINNFTYNGVTQNIQFPVVTDANGNYNIKLPDAPNGYSYTETTAPQITVSQKMFVRYFQNIDDPFNTLPHIDSVNTTLSLGYPNILYNSAQPIYYPSYTKPNNSAFYLLLPKDAKGNQIFIPLGGFMIGNINNNQNYLNYNTSNSPTYTVPPANEADSIYGSNGNYAIYSYNSGSGWTNAVSGINNDGYSLYQLFSYNDRNYNYPAKVDTLTATLIDITGKFIVNAPKMSAFINAGGKIQKVGLSVLSDNTSASNGQTLPGAGGKFAGLKNSNNIDLSQNVFGARTPIFKTNTSYSPTNFTLQGGVTKTVNFDYANLTSRDKNPQ